MLKNSKFLINSNEKSHMKAQIGGMIFYEEYEITLDIAAPASDEKFVILTFEQWNSDNLAFFKDPQSLGKFSLSRFGSCGSVNCGPLFLGYNQSLQSALNPECENGHQVTN